MIGYNATEVDWSDELVFKVINKDDGFIYQGQTLNGQKQGVGRQYGKFSGEMYEGQFVDGQRTGYGRIINSDGSFFIGIFANGVYEGEQIFYYNKDKELIRKGRSSFNTFKNT